MFERDDARRGHTARLRGCAQSHVLLSGYRKDEPAIGGAAEISFGIVSTWFDDTDGMRESAKTDVHRRTREDEDAFVEVPLAFVITREHVVVEPPPLD